MSWKKFQAIQNFWVLLSHIHSHTHTHTHTHIRGWMCSLMKAAQHRWAELSVKELKNNLCLCICIELAMHKNENENEISLSIFYCSKQSCHGLELIYISRISRSLSLEYVCRLRLYFHSFCVYLSGRLTTNRCVWLHISFFYASAKYFFLLLIIFG